MPRNTYLVPHAGCPTFEYRPLASGLGAPRVVQIDAPEQRSRLCESVLGELPEWFGIEAANAAYVRDVAGLPVLAVEDKGFVALKLHTPKSAELYVMGVRPEHHRRGLGTALLAAAEDYLCARGIEYLQVKTLGPSRPSEAYDRTRRFYEARGFVPLEELQGLWDGNPCLLLVKRLRA